MAIGEGGQVSAMYSLVNVLVEGGAELRPKVS